MIAMITDFGYNDIYSPIMKGVIKSINPNAEIIDITNSIHPQNIRQGAFLLGMSYKYFPAGTTFLCVVDPGVGSERLAIAIKIEDYYFVSPDNGLLSCIIENENILEAVSISNSDYFLKKVSSTFHGRDIFAPVSAYIDKGVSLSELGEAICENKLQYISINPSIINNKIIGEILHIDNYGNAISNIHNSLIKNNIIESIIISNERFSEISESYYQVKEDEPLTYFGSSGHLEFGIRNGNFADSFHVNFFDKIQINFQLNS